MKSGFTDRNRKTEEMIIFKKMMENALIFKLMSTSALDASCIAGGASVALLMLFAKVMGNKRRRINIRRGDRGWASSTMASYLSSSHPQVWHKNFRVNVNTFDNLLERLQGGGFFLDGYSRNNNLNVPGKFKLGTALYYMAQGTGWKGAADCASIGESTVHKYVAHLLQGCMVVLQPLYMPAAPPTAEALQQIRAQFAARRGFPNVGMAVDGSHVPFRAPSKYYNDYRNYKGWHSILVVAFVNSYHLFVNGEVGSPGRSGDNTVLSTCAFLSKMAEDEREREAWLGKDGVILADGGASDGSSILMNPYRCPQDPDQQHFNFIHSSTRFFVEETFGRWKNRFRFLLKAIDVEHHLAVRMIFTSMILHNACTLHRDDAILVDPDADSTNEAWLEYFKRYESHRCPDCVFHDRRHCVHDAPNRNMGRIAEMKGDAWEMREQLKNLLWCAHMNDVADVGAVRMRSLHRPVHS